MRLPNKLFEYKKTDIINGLVVLKILENKKQGMKVLELFRECNVKIGGVHIFLDTLDFLYAVDKVRYDSEMRRLFNVK